MEYIKDGKRRSSKLLAWRIRTNHIRAWWSSNMLVLYARTWVKQIHMSLTFTMFDELEVRLYVNKCLNLISSLYKVIVSPQKTRIKALDSYGLFLRCLYESFWSLRSVGCMNLSMKRHFSGFVKSIFIWGWATDVNVQ